MAAACFQSEIVTLNFYFEGIINSKKKKITTISISVQLRGGGGGNGARHPQSAAKNPQLKIKKLVQSIRPPGGKSYGRLQNRRT